MAQLSQINIGRLIAQVDDPRLAEFVSQLDEVNALAESSPGFVWRLKSDSGNATDIAYSDDLYVHVNMSVWQSIESLKEFTYGPRHLAVFRNRQKWFEKMSQPHLCLWWIPDGHIPSVKEGRERLEHYQSHGPSAHAFSFTESFPAPSFESATV
jgi:hypothetical protein